jgi:hypothetical protein
MLSFVLRRVLPARVVPFLALWEVYTVARWLYGIRAGARVKRPNRLVVSGDPGHATTAAETAP